AAHKGDENAGDIHAQKLQATYNRGCENSQGHGCAKLQERRNFHGIAIAGKKCLRQIRGDEGRRKVAASCHNSGYDKTRQEQNRVDDTYSAQVWPQMPRLIDDLLMLFFHNDSMYASLD